MSPTTVAPGPGFSPRRWQYSLRTLLAVITIAAIALAWHANRVRKQRVAVTAVLNLGGTLHYDFQFDPQEAFIHDAEPSAPRWVSDWLGEDYFTRVVEADLSGSPCRDEDLVVLLGLPALRKLDLTNTPITDQGIPHLVHLTSLTELALSDTHVTDEGVWLLTKLPALQRLSLEGTNVSPNFVRRLVEARPEWTVLR